MESGQDPPNAGSYFGYVSGVAAAKTSKTRKLGFIGAKPIPAVPRSINSFTLGARSVDPSLAVKAIFAGDWPVPTKEVEATNVLADGDGGRLLVRSAADRSASR